jgi:hypothetical protein
LGIPLENVQHRAIRYYLGVHRFAHVLVITGDEETIDGGLILSVTGIDFFHSMNRLTRKIFETDYSLCSNNWCSDLKEILS